MGVLIFLDFFLVLEIYFMMIFLVVMIQIMVRIINKCCFLVMRSDSLYLLMIGVLKLMQMGMCQFFLRSLSCCKFFRLMFLRLMIIFFLILVLIDLIVKEILLWVIEILLFFLICVCCLNFLFFFKLGRCSKKRIKSSNNKRLKWMKMLVKFKFQFVFDVSVVVNFLCQMIRLCLFVGRFDFGVIFMLIELMKRLFDSSDVDLQLWKYG